MVVCGVFRPDVEFELDFREKVFRRSIEGDGDGVGVGEDDSTPPEHDVSLALDNRRPGMFL